MENRKAETDRSEAVLRWVAAGLVAACFAAVVSCGGEEAGAEIGEIAFVESSREVPTPLPMVRELEMPVAAEPAPPAPAGDPSKSDAGRTAAPVTDEVAGPETDGAKTPWERYELGISAWKSGETALAEGNLREWVAHAPEHVKGRMNLARVLIELGRPREARGHATIAAGLDPASASVKRVLARSLAESGDRSAALAMYEEALWLDPEDRWSLNNMGYLLILRGRHDEAVGPLALAARLDSANAMFQANLGAALEGAGYLGAAPEAFDRSVALDPGHARAAASAARLRQLVGEHTAGEVDTSRLADDFRRELLGTAEREEPGRYECPW